MKGNFFNHLPTPTQFFSIPRILISLSSKSSPSTILECFDLVSGFMDFVYGLSLNLHWVSIWLEWVPFWVSVFWFRVWESIWVSILVSIWSGWVLISDVGWGGF